MVNPSPVSVARATAAIAVLAQCDSYPEARERLRVECDEDSDSGLRAVFARAGMKAPSAYLRGAVKARGERAGEAANDEGPASEPGPRDTTPAPPAAPDDDDLRPSVLPIEEPPLYTGAPPPSYGDDPDEDSIDTVVRRVVRSVETPDRTYVNRSPVYAPREPVAPFAARRWLIVPDAHWPFVDHDAWQLMLRVGRFIQPHGIICLGDMYDAYASSFHPKNPIRARRLVDELEGCDQALDDLDSLGAETKQFLAGNHCNRTARLIEQQAPALHGLRGTSIEEVFGITERGWQYHKYMVELLIGKVHFCHDYGQAGRYALARAVRTIDADVVMGHVHTMQTVHELSSKGETISGNTFGWLGDFKSIDYMHRGIAMQTWAHGCGWGVEQPDGGMRREGIRFINGKAKVDGQHV